MTRYSASRGIAYTAPPGPSGDRGSDGETSVADADADRAANVDCAADADAATEMAADD